MGVIRLLPPGLVNRIAAGECVERPASVVKELVENALDAGAGRIDVTIEDGGRALIRVADDGAGMDAEDLRLAVAPHATSKIREDDDLFNIHTMGFRGEAIASIASVSRLSITSRRAEGDVGHVLRVEGGKAGEVAPIAAPPGTTVEVRDLFYCVPARRRFLRTNQTETGHITEQLARIALAHEGVAFSLTNGKRRTHDLPAAADRRQRIGDFYGREMSDVLLPVLREGGGVRVEGLVAPPAECRGSSKWEYVFVNGRFIRDKFVSHAVREAYRSLIDPSAYPVVFLYITIDPGYVDVNVHPTKIEVRWRDSNFVHSQVLAALRDKFLSSNLDRRLRAPGAVEAHQEGVRQAMVEFFTGARNAPPEHGDDRGADTHRSGATGERGNVGAWDGGKVGAWEGGNAGTRESAPGDAADHRNSAIAAGGGIASVAGEATADSTPTGTPGAPQPSGTAASGRYGSDRSYVPTFPRSPAAGDSSLTPGSRAAGAFGPPRALQIHNSYLVVETEDGLMIIDQHALHERVLYEQFQARLSRSPLESQRMLIPASLRVAPERVELLETHAEVLSRLGIDLREAGPQMVALHAFPTFLERVDPVEFVRDLLDQLARHAGRPQADTLLHELLDMMACKAAVKAGDPLSPAEIEALLAHRDAAQRTSNCPHGRPTTLRLTLRELEKQFERR